MEAKVSVVVPVYNVEKYLCQCLDSICEQTLKEIEIILIDDGSTDNSGKICNYYAHRDERIRVIHQNNEGLGRAYNVGIAAAKGEYIGLVEPDDWIEYDMYEIMYKNAKALDTEITRCNFFTYNNVRKNKNILNQGIKNLFCNEPQGIFDIIEYPLLCAYPSAVWSGIYKSSFIKNIKFKEVPGRAAYVDAPFMFEALIRARRISYVSNGLYHWRIENHNNSISIMDKRAIDMADRFIESKEILKKYNMYEKLKECFYLHAFNATITGYTGIDGIYKRQYFRKLRILFGDMIDDKEFQYTYMSTDIKKKINHILNNNFFLSQNPFGNIKQFIKFIGCIKIHNFDFIITILGFQIYKGKWGNFPFIKTFKISERGIEGEH